MKQKAIIFLQVALGIVFVVSGLLLLKLTDEVQGFMRALPFVMIGLGCGAFGNGTGILVHNRILKGSPDLKKQMDINTNDERNVYISNRSKAKAYDIMTYVFGALILSFSLMNIDMIAIILLVVAYLLVHGCEIYYHVKYDKEM